MGIHFILGSLNGVEDFKKFIVLAVQGLAPTYRYPLTTKEMGWWRDLRRGNGTKNVENYVY